MKLYFQGDLCIELVDDAALDGARVVPHARDGALVLAEGEVSGHRHAFYDGGAALFHFGALAADVPDDLYIGHLRIDADAAELRHEEHDTVTLPKGLYRVRRQREYSGSDLLDPPGERTAFAPGGSRWVED